MRTRTTRPLGHRPTKGRKPPRHRPRRRARPSRKRAPQEAKAIAGIETRPARPEEYGAVGELVAASYASLWGDLGVYAGELREVADRARSTTVLVALDAGRVVGTVTYVPGPGPYFELKDLEAAGVRMLAVSPESQGHGVGRALMEACLARARGDGRGRIGLHTTDEMVVAKRLYRRLGFRRAGHMDWDIGDRVLRGYAYEFSESPG
ncbi:MAG: GNAT family N-acetyltransferase [Candidatus Limnocylindrales bacterium]